MAKDRAESKTFKRLKRNLLTILTVTGVILGVSIGLILKEAKANWSIREISYVKYLGELFLSMLKGLILPLIVSSMIAAVGSLDLSISSKIGGRGIAFYMITTLSAIILGIVLTVTIQPGAGVQKKNEFDHKKERTLVQDTLMDLVRTMFPPNIVAATMEHYRTKLILPEGKDPNNTRLEEYNMKGIFEGGTNIMGLIVFSIVVGVATAKLGDHGKPVLRFFQSFAEIMTLITGWVVWLSPIGVASLIAGEILRTNDFVQILQSLGWYLFVVVLGMLIHGFIVLPLIFTMMTRRLPLKFILNMMPAIFTAFGTGSSSATMPVTLRCLEEKNKVDSRVSRFLIPIGATINMDGTALYEAVAAIFIAQVVGLEMTIGKVIAISITATVASIGAAGIPHGGLVTFVMVLSTIGLPPEYISYIVPIDWLVDRVRTAINVLGDSFGAAIVHKLSRSELSDLPKLTNNDDDEESSELDELKCGKYQAKRQSSDIENGAFEHSI